MAESMLESPNIQTQMGDTVGSHASLEVSISFGRFENDNSLSWEKWSSFSQNKYLEEVEKCSTPGSVAQKKAYFESRYKKVAARKIELLEQQNQTETDASTSNHLNLDDHTENIHNTDIEHNPDSIDGNDEPKVDNVSPSRCDRSWMFDPPESDDLKYEDHTHEPNKDQFVDESKVDAYSGIQDSNRNVEICEVDELNEADSVKEETSLAGSDNDIRKEETLKLQEPNISKKITVTRRERISVDTKAKVLESSTRKPTQRSTSRVSKPPPTSNSTPAVSIKKSNISSSPRSKSCLERKRVGPTSLHMSISLGSLNSDPSSVNTMPSSLIMEKMRDKDVVKRAFKSFQNSTSNNEKSEGLKQVDSVSTTAKLSERTKKPTEKMDARRGQLGKIGNSASSGSIKEGGVNGRNLKLASSAIGLKSVERAEKIYEVSKKSHAKELEKTHPRSKAKEDEKLEMRQSLNFKAKPMPDFYRSRAKNSSEKEDAKKKKKKKKIIK